VALTTAIVLNWRRPSDTIACVGSLIAIDRDLDIVVVDNGSGDGSLAAIAQGLAPIVGGANGRYALHEADGVEPVPAPGACVVTLVQSGRNGGYAFGNNVGIRLALAKADCQYIWILNNDTVVRDGSSLDTLLDKMARQPAIGLCGSTVAYAGQDGMVQALGGGAFDSRLGRCTQIGNGRRLGDPVDEAQIESAMAYVNGAAAFARRAFIEDVGLMSEDYFLYYEEIDWAKRSAGRWKLGFCAASVVYHEVGASIGTDDFGGRSPLSTHYLTRNRLKFLARHAPRALPMAAVDLVKDALRHLRRGERVQAGTMARALLGLDYRSSSR
jgi:GT2 family glycosyltransferase